jgi:hypothetical protein
VTLVLMAVVAAAAGCASAPSGGLPRRATGSGSQVQAYVQPLPPPAPTSAWGPTDVVLGFLHASASYAVDPAAAEHYLVPEVRKSWHPANRPVAVVGSLRLAPEPLNKPEIEGASTGETVLLTGQQLATLSQTGQYQYTPGQSIPFKFTLARINGVWLIDALPPGLLLTQSDFQSVYQARNLFFYAPAGPAAAARVLVPDPVYAPLESSNSALNTDLATGLVNGLLKGPGDWLSGATSSAFPTGTRLLKQVTITGGVARVDLGGAAAHASALQVQIMKAQLRATLGDQSYSAPLASQLQLYINNRLQVGVWPLISTGLHVSRVSTGPLLAVTAASTVGQLHQIVAHATASVRVKPAQIGDGQITAIASEPAHGRTPPIAVAVQDGTGCAVLLAASGQTSYHPYVLSTSGGTCTSLSWDNDGNLWAATSRAAWVLEAQNRRPIALGIGALAIDQPGSQILAVRMAPDSVRAALLVHTRSGNKLLLAAVLIGHGTVSFGQPVNIGGLPNGADPIAISWLDVYHLAVLADNGFIYAMPLTGGASIQAGGAPQPLGPAPDGALTLTTDGSEVVVGALDSGGSRIFVSSPASPGWTFVIDGSDPVYPG